jgi:hypothetical protein
MKLGLQDATSRYCWRRHVLISNGWFLQVYNWTGLSDENSQDVVFPYRTFIELLIQY